MRWFWIRRPDPDRVRVPNEVLTPGQAAVRRITSRLVYLEPVERRRARIETAVGLVVGGAFWLLVWNVYVEGFGGWLKRRVGPSNAILLLFVLPVLTVPLAAVAFAIFGPWLRRRARPLLAKLTGRR
jgi:hypothetical protein